MDAQQIKILLVDDKPENLDFLCEILICEGYEVEIAISGQQALDAVNASSPDLILLDILMPEMDGYQVCQYLKGNPKTQDIPIIFLSAIDELSDKIKAFKLGAVDYISKPLQPEEVVVRVENQITIQKLQKQLKAQNAQLENEIKERQRVAVELKNRNTEIESIFNAAQVGICLTDENGCFVNVNPAYCQFYGFTREELIGQPITRHYPNLTDVEKADLIQQYQNCLRNGSCVEDGEFSIRRKDGFLLSADIKQGIFQKEDGKLFVVTTVMDISDRQLAQEAQKSREGYLTALVEVQRRLFTFDGGAECYAEIVNILGPVSQASRVYVFENHRAANGGLLMSQRAEWCAVGIHPEIDNPALQNLDYEEFFPRWTTLLSQGEIVSGIVAEFPESEREILEPQGILAILILPIIAKGEFLGFIGFDNCVEPRLWGNSEVAFLQSAAVAISLAYERKQTELALQASQRRYQTLAEASPVAIFHTDADGYCLYLNKRWGEITGLSLQDSLGYGWVQGLHPEDRDRVMTAWNEAVTAKRPHNAEHRFIRPDSTIIWVMAQAVPEIGDDGEVKGFIVTVTDITEFKLTEAALRESADRERTTAQVIQKMRQTLNLEEIFATTTQELRQVLNCDRVVVCRFNTDWSGEFIAESMGSGWLSLIAEHQNDPNFTESALLDDGCAVQLLDSQDNQVPDTYLQETQGGAYSRGASFLCVPDIYKAGFDECYIHLLERFQAKAYITVPIFCGSQLWGLLGSYQNSNPRQWKTGEINIAVQIGNQLGVALQQGELLAQTQRQSQALQQAVIAADAANRAKSEFIANMSHELRTPLNAILGFTQIMSRDHSLSSEHEQNLAIINRAGEHLLNLINDILEMSKIEAGRTTLNVTSFDLIRLLDNLQEMLRLRAASKGLELVFEYAQDLPQHVEADSSKLRQVLLNLLGNAIKFTNSGSVTLRVGLGTGDWGLGTRKETDSRKLVDLPNTQYPIPSTRSLIFEVIDTGIGIDNSEIDMLFEAFGQTESGRKSQQGTGLGLVISRKYVQLMGGNISVSSTVDVGSTFTFDIQIGIASGSEIPINQIKRQVIGLAPQQVEYRILIVDDATESRMLLMKILSNFGFNVMEVTNGKEAIAVWESWQPHLILMDMRMPVMDGYQATKVIKVRERGRQGTTGVGGQGGQGGQGKISSPPSLHTVIIALTANAFEEQRQAMVTAGCDDFINKPFREELLLEKLSEHLGVKYLYQEESDRITEERQKTTEQILTASDIVSLLPQLSPEFVTQIYHAAAQCSDDLILQLLDEIPSENAMLKNYFTNLAHNFQFEKIMQFTSNSH